jgi:hypothetical protein
MDVRILDLDGSLTAQKELLRSRPAVYALGEWGPRLRLACRFGRFRRFEQALAGLLGAHADTHSTLTLYGSGDFHHLTLALLRRLRTPFNLLVLDNHPDWMRGIPLLHCGTWLAHAVRLPMVRNVFHLGGDVDFDNAYRWLAPWPALRSGKITVFPAVRRFRRGGWASVKHEPLRVHPEARVSRVRLEYLLHSHRGELARWPLYVSLDKDVISPDEAVVNWDSGHLTFSEAETILGMFESAAFGNLAGMDVVGDWSPVRVQGWLRRLLHLTEHPALAINPSDARHVNERTNLALLAGWGLRDVQRSGSLSAAFPPPTR